MNDSSARPRRSALDRRGFLTFGVGAGAWMGLLNARAPSAQGQATLRSIDMHAHWTPVSYNRALSEVGSTPRQNNSPYNLDLGQRVQWMDEHGVQVHCLTILTPPWDWASPEFAAHLTRVVNDAAIEAHRAYPDRFVAGVAMPIQEPELALAELNRVAGNPTFRAVHLPNAHAGKDYLFEPEFEPILARCQELELPLLFHPLGGDRPGADRLAGPAFLNNSIGNPFEHTITAAKFITTGTLDKFPTLEILLAHAGGAFPIVAGRVEHGLARSNITLPRPFMEYVRRFHYDTIAYYPETLRFLIDLVGADRVVIGTDYFARMDVEDTAGLVESLNLPAADQELILSGNARRLLKL
jgi:aminocarboxymuconate-semialdehyde decarboxylase